MSGIERLRAALTLTEVSADVFAARTGPVPWPKAYGGDLLTHAAAAAGRTVTADRSLHAMHTLFVAPASIGAEIHYRVERLRDGRSYSSRQVTGTEDGRTVVSTLCSFHVGESSASIPAVAPLVPAPEDLPTAAERVEGAPVAAAEYWAGGRSFDIRHVGSALYTQPVGEPRRELQYWARAFAPIDGGAEAHRLALVYLCDYGMLEPAMRATGLAWTDPGLTTASLDHSMWFHADARADEWLLSSLRLVSYSHGRALVEGDYFAADGTHVATVIQQGMIRRRDADGS